MTVLEAVSVASTYSGCEADDAEAVALTDGVDVRAVVLAERVAVLVEDLPGALAEAAVTLQERALAGSGEEAEILRVALARDRESGTLGHCPDLILVHVTEREAQFGQRLRAAALRAHSSGPC